MTTLKHHGTVKRGGMEELASYEWLEPRLCVELADGCENSVF